jgi:hypothetical protein
MFVQVIKGRTSDPEGMQRQAQRWISDVRPSAIGHLGGTFGIADDGTFVVLARFEDEQSARANSERPEQQSWWEETARFSDGEATLRESSDLTLLFGGGSDDAGFVQVMEGTVTDRPRSRPGRRRSGSRSFAPPGPICWAAFACGSRTERSWRPRTSPARTTPVRVRARATSPERNRSTSNCSAR